jgi:hypothetical protein
MDNSLILAARCGLLLQSDDISIDFHLGGVTKGGDLVFLKPQISRAFPKRLKCFDSDCSVYDEYENNLQKSKLHALLFTVTPKLFGLTEDYLQGVFIVK